MLCILDFILKSLTVSIVSDSLYLATEYTNQFVASFLIKKFLIGFFISGIPTIINIKIAIKKILFSFIFLF